VNGFELHVRINLDNSIEAERLPADGVVASGRQWVRFVSGAKRKFGTFPDFPLKAGFRVGFDWVRLAWFRRMPLL
jgi:hypothetical protein